MPLSTNLFLLFLLLDALLAAASGLRALLLPVVLRLRLRLRLSALRIGRERLLVGHAFFCFEVVCYRLSRARSRCLSVSSLRPTSYDCAWRASKARRG